MRKATRAKLTLSTVSFMAAMAMAARGHATKTFYIDESTDFTGNGCENADLNDVTSALKADLETYGSFTGSRYVNSSAWPQDFVEACDSSFGSGLDSTYADTKVLSVYAGHGNSGLLQWGTAHNGQCTLQFQPNMRLGSEAGASSGLAVYLTSCTLKIDHLGDTANNQWERQQFGFHNSPAIGDNDPGTFAHCTLFTTATNVSCYLGNLEDRPAWFTGDNSPIVVGQGTDSSDCQYTQNHARLHGDVLNSNRGGGPSCLQSQPSFWYCYNWIDHGTSGVCS